MMDPYDFLHQAQEDAAAAHTQRWLLSFADLLSLLLTFFIMLFAMSGVEPAQWQPMAKSFSTQMSNAASARNLPISSGPVMFAAPRVPSAINLEYLFNVLNTSLKKQPDLREIHIASDHDKLLIVLPKTTMFEEGKNALSLKAISILFFLGDILFQIGNKIQVTAVISTNAHESSASTIWAQAFQEAIVIAQELQKSGYVYDIDTFVQTDTPISSLNDPSYSASHDAFIIVVHDFAALHTEEE